MEYEKPGGEVHAHIVSNSLRFHWHVGQEVAGSARPGRYGDLTRDLARIRDEGIRVIVNLTSEPIAIPAEMADDFEEVHTHVQDCEPPTPDQLLEIIARVRAALAANQRVLVHCRGGVGRTATVLIPILMELTGASLDEAVKELKKAGRFVQSMHQWNFLLEWSKERGEEGR